MCHWELWRGGWLAGWRAGGESQTATVWGVEELVDEGVRGKKVEGKAESSVSWGLSRGAKGSYEGSCGGDLGVAGSSDEEETWVTETNVVGSSWGGGDGGWRGGWWLGNTKDVNRATGEGEGDGVDSTGGDELGGVGDDDADGDTVKKDEPETNEEGFDAPVGGERGLVGWRVRRVVWPE